MDFEGTLGGKWLELLREIAPDIGRAGFLFNPTTAQFAEYFLESFKVAGRSFGVKPVHDVPELKSTVATLARERKAGLIIMPETFLNVHGSDVLSLAADHHLLAAYPHRFFAELGGLMSFGSDPLENFRHATTYVDRILKGEMPADLPLQVCAARVASSGVPSMTYFTAPPVMPAMKRSRNRL